MSEFMTRAKAGIYALMQANEIEKEYLEAAIESLEDGDNIAAARWVEKCMELDRAGTGRIFRALETGRGN